MVKKEEQHVRSWAFLLGLAALTQPACSLLFDPSTYEGDGGLDSGGLDARTDQDAPRDDAWLDPSVDANADATTPDAPPSPCDAPPDRLPTCSDRASQSYCDRSSSTVVDVPRSVFDLALMDTHPTVRVGTLPPATLLDLEPGATSGQGFALDRVDDEIYFGLIRTTDAWLGHATFGDAISSPSVVRVVSPVDAYYPKIALHRDQAWMLGGRRIWGPFTIPAMPVSAETRSLGPEAGDGGADIVYAGDVPVVILGTTIIEPPGPTLPRTADLPSFHGVPYLVHSDFSTTENVAAFLPAGDAGVLSLGPGSLRITHLWGDGAESVYAAVDSSMVASTGNLRIRRFYCRPAEGCAFTGEPLLVNLGVVRQEIHDFRFEELDRSASPPRVLVVSYVESGFAVTHIDALIWRGAPLEVTPVPVTTVDGYVHDLSVRTRRDQVGETSRFDILVGFSTSDPRPQAAVSALRMLGCP